MPKTTMNKNHFAMPRQHDIRTTRKVTTVKAKSIPHTVY